MSYEENFRKPLSDAVSPLLKRFFGPLDDFLIGLPPWVWLTCAISLFVIAGCIVWTLKRSYVYLGAPDQSRWRDLRIWSTLLLIPYIVIYLLLGR
jgi:hypothetical protein